MAFVRRKANGFFYLEERYRDEEGKVRSKSTYLGEHPTLDEAYIHHEVWMWHWYDEHNRTVDEEKKRLYMTRSAYHRKYADKLRHYIHKQTGVRPPSFGPSVM